MHWLHEVIASVANEYKSKFKLSSKITQIDLNHDLEI